MAAKVITVGNKLELHIVRRTEGANQEETKVYYSTITDILSENMIEIAMPIEKGRLVLLQENSEFSAVFHDENGLYQCMMRVIRRCRTGKVYSLAVQLMSEPKKYQRREYYRFDCRLEMEARPLLKEERKALETDLFYVLREDLPGEKAVIEDISGGGIRFTSEILYAPETLLRCTFGLARDEKVFEAEAVCKVLRVEEPDGKKGRYEHRAIFYDINESVRENIIKWIFEEERRLRQKDIFS